MRMLSLALVALLSTPTALADTFEKNECDGSDTVDFDMAYDHVATGTTNFTFEACSLWSSPQLCQLEPQLCMTGDFSTKDGGTGVFQTSVETRPGSCSALPGPISNPPAGFHWTTATSSCKYDQALWLQYDTTNVIYDGSNAGGGSYTRKARYYCTTAGNPGSCVLVQIGQFDNTGTYADAPFSGDIIDGGVDIGDFECDH